MAESILQRVARGDQSAVEECLSQFGGLVWSLAKRLSKTDADAEDATQEIFLEIWKNSVKYDSSISSEATFITMIARRRLIDRHRKQTRTLDTVSMDADFNSPGEVEPDRVEIAEEATRARECLQQLRPDERKVLELSVFHHLSQAKIADMLEIPLGTVKTHARRGMIRLRELLSLESVTGGAK